MALFNKKTNQYQRTLHNCIVAMTDTAGTPVQTYSYDSFGNITQSGSINQPFTYTVREYDTETGMYFYRARYYDPKSRKVCNKKSDWVWGWD